MDPRFTGEMLKHLEKQNELLMEAYNSMSHELHKLQVEEEMLMRKFFELMTAQGSNKKHIEGNTKVMDGGQTGDSTITGSVANGSEDGQSIPLVPTTNNEQQ